MKNILLVISTCLIAISGSAGVMTCAEENSPIFVQINEDSTGYVNTEDMCILLTCTTDTYGLMCVGFNNTYGYSIFIHEQSMAVVTRSDGLNYDTLSILSCTSAPEATPEA